MDLVRYQGITKDKEAILDGKHVILFSDSRLCRLLSCDNQSKMFKITAHKLGEESQETFDIDDKKYQIEILYSFSFRQQSSTLSFIYKKYCERSDDEILDCKIISTNRPPIGLSSSAVVDEDGRFCDLEFEHPVTPQLKFSFLNPLKDVSLGSIEAKFEIDEIDGERVVTGFNVDLAKKQIREVIDSIVLDDEEEYDENEKKELSCFLFLSLINQLRMSLKDQNIQFDPSDFVDIDEEF